MLPSERVGSLGRRTGREAETAWVIGS
jgi:hypothetical protein